MVEKDSVIEKVKKLLALAGSPNAHEAQVAMMKAQELLSKHNLTMGEVEESKLSDEYGMLQGDVRVSASPEDKYIVPILEMYFHVQCVEQRGHGFNMNTMRMARVRAMTFIGRKHSIEIAKYVRDFLTRTMRRGFAKLKKDDPLAKRGSYYTGFYVAMRSQLEANRPKDTTGTALATVRDPNIDKFIKQALGETQTVKGRKMDASDAISANAGYADGEKTRIAVGVGTDGERSQIGQVYGLEHK